MAAIIAIALISLIMFERFTDSLNATIIEENAGIIGKAGESIDSYLRNAMKISDSIYYNVIKNTDISDDNIKNGMNLIYVNNDNMIDDIALIAGDGTLIESMPALRLRDGIDVSDKDFFKKSMAKSEYIYFSMPHIRNLFDRNENSYSWVISMSRAVEVTSEGKATQAVLLINLNYMFFEELFSNVNLGNGGYIYLINDKGDIIWHPRQNEIYAGRFMENNKYAAGLKDGISVENIGGKKLTVNIRTIGYTGWKFVGVTGSAALNTDGMKFRLFVLFVADLFLFLLAVVNAFISNRISNPIVIKPKNVDVFDINKSGSSSTNIFTSKRTINIDYVDMIARLYEILKKDCDNISPIYVFYNNTNSAGVESEIEFLKSKEEPSVFIEGDESEFRNVIEDLVHSKKSVYIFSLDKCSTDNLCKILGTGSVYNEHIKGFYCIGATTLFLNKLDDGNIDAVSTLNEYDMGYSAVEMLMADLKKTGYMSNVDMKNILLDKESFKDEDIVKQLFPIE